HLGFLDAAESTGRAEPWARLEIGLEFDGRRTVTAPLDVFLAHCEGASMPSTWLIGTEKDAFLHRRVSFVMPYEKGFRIVLRNTSAESVEGLLLQIRTEPYEWRPSTLTFQ